MSSGAMTPPDVIVLVTVALLIIWGFVLVDIIRQPRMPAGHKVAWALACTVVWPVQVVYLMVRPQRGRAESVIHRVDPHARLVDAALDHEAGRIDAAQFEERVAALRAVATRPGPAGRAEGDR